MVPLETAFAQTVDVDVGGRYMLDYTHADLTDDDVNIRAGGIRRLRVNLSGDVNDIVDFEVELDIDGDDLKFTDLKLAYAAKGSPWTVTFGQQRITASLDEQTSSRFSSTLERAAFTDAFDFSRRVGLVLSHEGKGHHISLGGFSSNLEGSGGGSFARGKAASARIVYLPIKTDNVLVHLGGSWRYREKGKDNRDIRYEQGPYSRQFSDDLIKTNRFAEADNFFGLEAAVSTGNFWVAGEQGFLGANGDGAEPNANFRGGYIEAGYFFGGEKKYGGDGFGRPKVHKTFLKNGWGALSVVARYDQLDLQDEIYTGKLETVITGVDWWPSENTRLGVNYFNLDAENGSSDTGSGVLIRGQFDF